MGYIYQGNAPSHNTCYKITMEPTSKDDLPPDGEASTFSLIIGNVTQLLLEWGCVPFHAIYVKMYRWKKCIDEH